MAAILLALLAGCGSDPDPQLSPSPSASSASGGPSPSTPEPVPAGPDLAAFYEQDVRWRGCPSDEGFFDLPKDDFECTTVKVPLDYANPARGSIGLAVLRRVAKNSRGSLFVNPGGPGSSAVDYARAARVIVSKAVYSAFDIVGFDPRGVVGSDPVDCIEDSELDALFAADGTPDDAAEVAELTAQSEALGQGCKQRSPDMAPFMDTVSAAKDIDIILAVLGDEKFNMLGKSYGSFLAATYAELFPAKVGRLVLDGVVPSSLNSDELTFGQAKAFDMVLRRFVADCLTKDDCPLEGGVDAGVARIIRFLADLEAKPIPGTGDRMLTEALGTYAILSYMYAPPNDWDVLRYGLEVAFQGDGSVLMEMMDDRTQRNPDGTFANNGNEAFYAVNCLDRPGVGGVKHVQEVAQEWSAVAPVFGEYLAWGNLPCWQWPMGPGTAEAAGQPPVIRAEGSAPILVVSTKYDPATPYEWGVQVAGELDNARLLTFDGDGHTAYTSGSSCIDRAVDAYFLEGTLPAEGTVCSVDAGSGGTEA